MTTNITSRMNDETAITRTGLVSLPCDGSWRPVYPEFQHGDNRLDFVCMPSRYIVRVACRYGDQSPRNVYGAWMDRRDAVRRSWDYEEHLYSSVEVIEVREYWYQKDFGVVPTESVRDA